MEEVKAYLLNNVEELKNIVRELNSWDGSFEDLDVYDNDEDFFETFFNGKPMEAVRAAHFGDYSYAATYVRFNGYGNLETLDDYQYERELKEQIDEIVAALLENFSHLSLDPELEDLLLELEEEEEEE